MNLKNLISKIDKQPFLVFILINSTNVISYLYWLIIGREFDPEFFTFATSMNSLLMILTNPGATLPHLIVKFLDTEASDFEINRYLTNLFFFILAIFIIIFFSVNIFFDQFFFDMDIKKIHINFIVLISFLIYLKHLFTSLYQLKKKYFLFSIYQSLFIFFKFIIILFFIYLAINENFSFLNSNLIAVFLVLLILFLKFRKIHHFIFTINFFSNYEYKKIIKYFFILFISSFFITFLMNYDLIISRAYFDTKNAALYSSISIIGKSIFYLFSVFIFVIFPESALNDKKFNLLKFLLIIIFSFILGSGAILILYLFSDFIFGITFNGKYFPDPLNILIFSFSMLFLTITNLFLYFLIGKNKILFPLFMLMVIFLFYFIFLKYFTSSIFVYVFTQLISSLILFFTTVSYFVYLKKNEY